MHQCITILHRSSVLIFAKQRSKGPSGTKKFNVAKQTARPTKINCAFALAVSLILLLSFCMPGSSEITQKLSNTLYNAKLCLRNNHGQFVELGKLPDCNIVYHQAEILKMFS